MSWELGRQKVRRLQLAIQRRHDFGCLHLYLRGHGGLVIVGLFLQPSLCVLFAAHVAVDDAKQVLDDLGLFSSYISCEVTWKELCRCSVDDGCLRDVLQLAARLRKAMSILPCCFGRLLANTEEVLLHSRLLVGASEVKNKDITKLLP